jgi:hypothetical protein
MCVCVCVCVCVLQVVGSPPEALVETFFGLLPGGSPSYFQKILDLKVFLFVYLCVCLCVCVCVGGGWGGR